MPANLVEKILKCHVREGLPGRSREIGIRIDQAWIQGAVGTQACLQFETLGLASVRTALAAFYVEAGPGPGQAAYLEAFAARFDLDCSRVADESCHREHLERFSRPGTTLLGCDRLAGAAGAIGQLALAGSSRELAVALAGGSHFLANPTVYRVHLSGSWPDRADTGNLAAHLEDQLGGEDPAGLILEFGGAGVAALPVPMRVDLAQRASAWGVAATLFPSDGATLAYLREQQRERDWVEFLPDPDAHYARIIQVDLSRLETPAASAGGLRPPADRKEPESLQLHWDGSEPVADLRFRGSQGMAAIQEDDRLAPAVNLGLVPVFRSLPQALVPGCPRADHRSAGGPGRMSCRSPELAAPPQEEPLPEALHGVVGIKVGDRITAERILPAWAHLEYTSNISTCAMHLFESLEPGFPAACMKRKSQGLHTVIVAGEAFGQGAPGEHAAICLAHLGIKAVLARSFNRALAGMLVAYGILPLEFAEPSDYDRLGAGMCLDAPGWRRRVATGGMIRLDLPYQHPIPCTCRLPVRQRNIILAGDLLRFTARAIALHGRKRNGIRPDGWLPAGGPLAR
jgi:hypothetical protein